MAPSRLDDFSEFYAGSYASAYRTALGITGSRSAAEDATQEAYCSAYRRRSTFRGEGTPEAWLQRIVANAAIDQVRRARNRLSSQPSEDVTTGRDPLVDSAPDRLALAAAVATLPPRQRAAIVLHYFHGYPHRMVGEVLGMSEGAAAMTLHRALRVLRTALDAGANRADADPVGSSEEA